MASRFAFSQTARRNLLLLSGAAAAGPVTVLGGMYLWTWNCRFESFGPDNDGLFQYPFFKAVNPRGTPTSHDSCVRAVPFSKIKAALLEDARQGGSALIEALNGGMWGRYGFAIQRKFTMALTKDQFNKSDLWTPEEIMSSKFEPGEVVANHILVLEKAPSSLIMRGSRVTSATPLPFDTVCEVQFQLDEKKQRVVFKFKSITFNGTESSPRDEEPFGGVMGWLHLQYAKFLMEAAVGNCVR